MNQRGMEMAIQIFIVLFVLLAVSMLVLQLVSTQFTEQQNKLKDQQKKSAIGQMAKTSAAECESLCTDGSEDKLAQYCIKYFDFTSGSAVSAFDQTNFKAGVGVCDDRVYCTMLTSCTLPNGSQVSAQSCKNILCNYWSKNFGADRANKLIDEFIAPGQCYGNISEEQRLYHWYNMYYDGAQGWP